MNSKDRTQKGFTRGRTLAFVFSVALATSAIVIVLAQGGGDAEKAKPAKPKTEFKVDPADVAREAATYVIRVQEAEKEQNWWQTQEMFGRWYSGNATLADERPAETMLTLLGGDVVEAEDLATGKVTEGKWRRLMKGLEVTLGGPAMVFEVQVNPGVNGFSMYNPDTYSVVRFAKKTPEQITSIRRMVTARNNARRAEVTGVWVGNSSVLAGAAGTTVLSLRGDGKGEQRNTDSTTVLAFDWSIRGNNIVVNPIEIATEVQMAYTVEDGGKTLKLSIAGTQSEMVRISDMEYGRILAEYNAKRSAEVSKLITIKMKEQEAKKKPATGWSMFDWINVQSTLAGTWKCDEASLVGEKPGATTLVLSMDGTCLVTNTTTNTSVRGKWGFKPVEIRLTLDNGDDIKKPLELPKDNKPGPIKIDGKEFRKI